ncbi:methionine synthase [Candidatus Poribacteria bacterium]|nr:methionine synthase [Candidatus Poribacteria bacterium]
MKIQFLERLKNEILISDGAIGTMLQTVGCPPGACPEEWGIANREKLQSIHRSYLEAGADILLTNTLGGSRFKLGKYNLSDQTYLINKQAAEIVVGVARDIAYVAGDIGPTGEFMEPVGLIKEQEFYAAFAEQASGLKAGGADFIIIETMMALDEMQTAIKAAKETTGLPVIASMSFNVIATSADSSYTFRTMMGVDPKQAAVGMVEAGADVIGANCGDVLMAQMPALIKQLRSAVDMYIIAQANAGRPQLIDGKTVFSQSPEEIAFSVEAVVKAGANIIGGCCGTTPEHIRQIARKVKRDA